MSKDGKSHELYLMMDFDLMDQIKGTLFSSAANSMYFVESP